MHQVIITLFTVMSICTWYEEWTTWEMLTTYKWFGSYVLVENFSKSSFVQCKHVMWMLM